MNKYRHLFGPVNSRRLGLSLGVDLAPFKYCSLNCVYCEVQRTTDLLVERAEYIEIDGVLAELDRALQQKPHLDYITFSGAGEPTLNSGIGRVIQHIKTHYPEYKLALLTNGTLLYDKQLRQEILPCDLILPSLDSASQASYEKINRPHPQLRIETLIQSLIDLRKEYDGQIWLEVFIIQGINDVPEELEAMIRAIEQIKPDLVQLNALDRPGAEEWVQAAPPELLHSIQRLFSARLTMPVEVIAKSALSVLQPVSDDFIAQIQAVLLRRPCTAEDLSVTLGAHINEVSKILRELNLQGKLSVKREARGVFYLWKE